jgi:hypothetical protein
VALDYRITAFDTPTAKVGTVIFDPRVRRYISAGKLSLKDVDVDSMSITVNPASPLYGHVQPMQTHIEVKLNGELIFRGRVLKPTRGMADGGAFSQSFSIESVEAYLMDTRQRQGEYHNISPKDFLAHLLEVHNAAVPSYKQFKLGDVTVTDPNDSLYRYTGYDTTWQTINDKLITPLGGFLRVRFEADGMYLDYLAEVGEEHQYDNPIKLGRNLKSASVDVDPTKVITRLIPLGATIQQEAAEGETADANGTQPRIKIASVDNGKDYIDIPELQTEFGVLEGTVEWDDVNDPKILLTKAQAWIKAQTAATQSWQADVVELDEGRFAGGFKVSDSYTFLAPQINPRALLRIKQKDIDFLNPHVPTLTIGDKSMTLTSYQRQNRANQRKVLQVAQTAKAQATSADANAKKAQETVVAMQEKLDALQKEADDAGLSGLSNQLTEIRNQLTSLFTNLGDMGTEIETIKSGQTTASGATLTTLEDRIKAIEIKLNETGGTTNV